MEADKLNNIVAHRWKVYGEFTPWINGAPSAEMASGVISDGGVIEYSYGKPVDATAFLAEQIARQWDVEDYNEHATLGEMIRERAKNILHPPLQPKVEDTHDAIIQYVRDYCPKIVYDYINALVLEDDLNRRITMDNWDDAMDATTKAFEMAIVEFPDSNPVLQFLQRHLSTAVLYTGRQEDNRAVRMLYLPMSGAATIPTSAEVLVNALKRVAAGASEASDWESSLRVINVDDIDALIRLFNKD